MTDLIEPNPEPVFAGPLPVETAPQVEPVVAEVEEAPVVEETPAEPEMFDRAYVEDLRKENAKWRTQYQEQKSIWDGFDPDEQKTLAEFIRLSRAAESGDEAAARQLQEMFGEEDAQEIEEPEGPLTAEDFRRIAREEAEAVAKAKEDARLQQEAVSNVNRQAEELGYKKGTPEHTLLLQFAVAMDEPDLTAADAKVKEWKQQFINDYLAKKGEVAENSPSVAAGSGAAPSLHQPPKTFEDARAALHERLNQLTR